MSGACEDRTLRLRDGRTFGYPDTGIRAARRSSVASRRPGSRLQVRAAHGPAEARGIRCVAPDRPGQGLSTRRRRARDRRTKPDDVRELRADALGIERLP